MIFRETKLKGAFLIEPEKLEDERGFFARSFCVREFEQHGLNPRLVQCNISFNFKKGTLRGMHYQKAPCAEAKLVRCTMGSICDVIVDLRPDSATYSQWFGVELSGHGTRPTAHDSLLTADCLPLPADHKMLYIPEGFAHGFITLEDNSEIFYQMSEFYSPQHAGGFRWNDPFFRIPWPVEAAVISERDRSYPDYIREQRAVSSEQ